MVEDNEFTVFKNTIADILGPTVASSLSCLGPFGAIPSAGITSYLAYKQRRQIEMLRKAISEIQSRAILIDDINKNPQKYRKLMEHIFDYCLKESQEEKISVLINGLETLVCSPSVDDDYILTYFDTLDELRFVDIAILRLWSFDDINERKRAVKELGLSKEQHTAITEKLVRLGLMNDTIFESINHIHYFIRYLKNASENKWNQKIFDTPSEPKNIRRKIKCIPT